MDLRPGVTVDIGLHEERIFSFRADKTNFVGNLEDSPAVWLDSLREVFPVPVNRLSAAGILVEAFRCFVNEGEMDGKVKLWIHI